MEVKEIVLVGDTGNVSRTKPDPVLELIKQHLPGENGFIAFLGDNVYPKGLPAEGHKLRKDAEHVLEQYEKTLSGYKGRTLFLSGNHDWNKGKRNGYEYVVRQQAYIEKLIRQPDIYLPKNGCPGPVFIPFDERLGIIVINTQWWLQSGTRPAGKQFGCSVSTEEEFFHSLENLITKHHDKKILVLGHSPVYSYSIHGGKYLFKHHLFPFTMYKKNAWVPLPFVGSLLPLYRKYIGAKEDIAHPRYRHLRKKLKEIFRQHKNLLYACGHEHNLQHISKYGNHFIVSGSGSKSTYVRKEGKYLNFGTKENGLFKLKLSGDGILSMETWITDPVSHAGRKVYEATI